MTIIHFITHPEVIIDPATTIPDWRLSRVGIRRMQLAARQPWITAVGTLFCSAERKAREAAEVLAPHIGLISTVIAALGENDRSSTGFLPKAEFEATADVLCSTRRNHTRLGVRYRRAAQDCADSQSGHRYAQIHG